MIEVFVLLVLFQFKHFIADYLLQFPYMYENKGIKGNWKQWVLPLVDHSGIHAILTLLIISAATTADIGVKAAAFDFATHFVIDRWKATRGSNPSESKFWRELGIDQMLHHLVGIAIIFGAYVYG